MDDDIPQVNGVKNKTGEDEIKRRNKSAAKSSLLAPASSQSTTEKQSLRVMTFQGEESAEYATLSLAEGSREALLEEVVALRMRIRVMEGLNNEGPGGRRASASDAPPELRR